MLVASSFPEPEMRPVRFSLPLAAAIVLFTPLALDAQTTMPASSATTDNGAPATALRQADALREAALRDDTAWQILESLTTEVGPRVAGLSLIHI